MTVRIAIRLQNSRRCDVDIRASQTMFLKLTFIMRSRTVVFSNPFSKWIYLERRNQSTQLLTENVKVEFNAHYYLAFALVSGWYSSFSDNRFFNTIVLSHCNRML